VEGRHLIIAHCGYVKNRHGRWATRSGWAVGGRCASRSWTASEHGCGGSSNGDAFVAGVLLLERNNCWWLRARWSSEPTAMQRPIGSQLIGRWPLRLLGWPPFGGMVQATDRAASRITDVTWLGRETRDTCDAFTVPTC
jgi:hypothetical protein